MLFCFYVVVDLYRVRGLPNVPITYKKEAFYSFYRLL